MHGFFSVVLLILGICFLVIEHGYCPPPDLRFKTDPLIPQVVGSGSVSEADHCVTQKECVTGIRLDLIVEGGGHIWSLTSALESEVTIGQPEQ